MGCVRLVKIDQGMQYSEPFYVVWVEYQAAFRFKKLRFEELCSSGLDTRQPLCIISSRRVSRLELLAGAH
jgi:hypothetical protein